MTTNTNLIVGDSFYSLRLLLAFAVPTIILHNGGAAEEHSRDIGMSRQHQGIREWNDKCRVLRLTSFPAFLALLICFALVLIEHVPIFEFGPLRIPLGHFPVRHIKATTNSVDDLLMSGIVKTNFY